MILVRLALAEVVFENSSIITSLRCPSCQRLHISIVRPVLRLLYSRSCVLYFFPKNILPVLSFHLLLLLPHPVLLLRRCDRALSACVTIGLFAHLSVQVSVMHSSRENQATLRVLKKKRLTHLRSVSKSLDDQRKTLLTVKDLYDPAVRLVCRVVVDVLVGEKVNLCAQRVQCENRC